jgi:hypothetical protein
LAINAEGSNRKGLVMQPESIDIPGIHASEIIENSRLFMSYFLRMLILAYLNISKIIKSSFSGPHSTLIKKPMQSLNLQGFFVGGSRKGSQFLEFSFRFLI